jgi:uncharacterized protein YndB with AHSA1/START domain
MSTTPAMAVTVSKTIGAPPETVFALVSDVTRMGEWSPETTKVTWVGEVSTPTVGTRFKGSNAIGKVRWSTKPTITSIVPGQEFTFKVPGKSGAEWTYRFESVDGGTLVTESVRQERRSPFPIRFLQRRAGVTDRAEHLRAGMTTTLERLDRAVRNTPR